MTHIGLVGWTGRWFKRIFCIPLPAVTFAQSVLVASLLIPGQSFLVFVFPSHPSCIIRMDKEGFLSTYLYSLHQVVQALWLPLLGEFSFQQGIFPKRSLDRNLEIDPFSPHHQTAPFKSLDRRPTSSVLARYR